MSGAGLTTIPMADITQFGLGCIFCLMLAGGITGLLIPPVLYRLWQYRQFKPMVQEVLALRKVIRRRTGEISADGEDHVEEHDLIGDFELQDEGLQLVAIVLVCYDLFFKVGGTIALYIAVNAYVRATCAACALPAPPLTQRCRGPWLRWTTRRCRRAWTRRLPPVCATFTSGRRTTCGSRRSRR